MSIEPTPILPPLDDTANGSPSASTSPSPTPSHTVDAEPSKWLTVAQASAESGFSEITVRRHIAKGALKVERLGPFRRIRITRAEFDRYLRPYLSSPPSLDVSA